MRARYVRIEVSCILSINEGLAQTPPVYLPSLHQPSTTRHSEDGEKECIHLKKVKQRIRIRETHNDPVDPRGRNLSGDNSGGFAQYLDYK